MASGLRLPWSSSLAQLGQDFDADACCLLHHVYLISNWPEGTRRDEVNREGNTSPKVTHVLSNTFQLRANLLAKSPSVDGETAPVCQLPLV